MSGKDEKLIPYYKIYVYGEDNDKVEEILVNPNINNTLGGVDGIYSLISSKFQQQYTPMNHTMKIKFTNIWYIINDINIYNFCVSGNLSTGDNILIKLLQNTLLNENNNKKNSNDNNKEYDEDNNNNDEEILIVNKIENSPIPQEKKIPCSLCRQNSEYLYKRLLNLFGPFRYKNKNYYAHFLCLIFIPEIQISKENNKFKYPGKIIHDYIGLKCAFCGEKGATLCCCYNNTENYYNPLNIKCKNRYHYLCAIKSGCKISKSTYNVLCPKHIKCGYPQKLEDIQENENNQINEKIYKEEIITLEKENKDKKEDENINIDEKNNYENEMKKKENCFYCKLVINEEESIQCFKCKNYFHEACVGISHKKDDYDINDLDEKNYMCLDCLFKKNNK